MNEMYHKYEGDRQMALLKEWRDAAYSQEMDRGAVQQFWGNCSGNGYCKINVGGYILSYDMVTDTLNYILCDLSCLEED